MTLWCGFPVPYKVVKDTSTCPTGKPWAVKKQTDGKVMGCHPTKEKANRQVRAIEANEAKEHNKNVLARLFMRG